MIIAIYVGLSLVILYLIFKHGKYNRAVARYALQVQRADAMAQLIDTLFEFDPDHNAYRFRYTERIQTEVLEYEVRRIARNGPPTH